MLTPQNRALALKILQAYHPHAELSTLNDIIDDNPSRVENMVVALRQDVVDELSGIALQVGYQLRQDVVVALQRTHDKDIQGKAEEVVESFRTVLVLQHARIMNARHENEQLAARLKVLELSQETKPDTSATIASAASVVRQTMNGEHNAESQTEDRAGSGQQ